MENILRFGIPIYFILFFGIAFIAKSVIVAYKIGKNPLVMPKDDSTYGLIGKYFKFTLLGLFIYTLFVAFFPKWNHHFLPLSLLDNYWIQYSGIGLLISSLIWTIIAQVHMKDSWRIGIDHETKTKLITNGLFSVSRNPIFFGMILSLLGLFLVTPNAFTMLFLVLGYVLIQIQIRLEEDFLILSHGQAYEKYKHKVRRLI